MKILVQIVKWLIIILSILFAIALFAGKTYVQATLLTLIICILIYWPKKYLYRVFGEGPSRIFRFIILIMLFIPIIIINSNNVKSSIYKSESGKQEILSIYDQKMEDWPQDYLDIYIETSYGTVHVIAYGDTDNPPLLMFHAAAMGAHSWAENLPPISDNFRIYAIDNIY